MNLENKIDKIEKKVEKVETGKESIAMSLLKDYQRQNKRLFIISLILCVMLSGLMIYTIWLLNDITVVETKETTETTEDYDINQNSGDGGNNNFINGNSNEVNN